MLPSTTTRAVFRFTCLLAGAFALCPETAWSVRPNSENGADARRFGLSAPPAESRKLGVDGTTLDAIRRFNDLAPKRSLRFGPQGLGDPAAGPARRDANEAAVEFLRQYQRELGLDPAKLRLEMARTAGGIHHLLFEQIVDGVPVEFSRIKVHLRESGEIVGLESGYRSQLPDSPVPGITEIAAAQAVAADMAVPPPSGGTLVFYPLQNSDSVRLAWKFRSSGRGGSWLYYVDAQNAEILFRYNDLRFQACQTSGTIRGEVFDVDPSSTPGPTLRGMPHQDVFVIDETSRSSTDANGFFCSLTPGRIFTSLQGPFVNVSHFNGPSMHYDNGGGTWSTFSSPVSSQHPYPNSSVITSTINAPAGAVKVLPQFATFDVGSFDSTTGDIVDNDQLAILDSAGNVVATYMGNKGLFRGAAVVGPQLRLRLKTTDSGTRNGFDVGISSYLVLNPALKFTPDNASSSFTWTAAQGHDATRDEINLFYQINLMHDFLAQGVNLAKPAHIDKPVPAMARVGPNLANAYYDPVHGNLAFGDVGNGFALDATVVRHEYVHFVVDQIYPILNFGQNGAISEALADYFSGSSLDTGEIGNFTSSALGGVGAFRDMDCVAAPPCRIFPTNWVGQVHQDSLMISQALWEIRTELRKPGQLGPAAGQACADGLAYQSLFFFPDSFQEFLKAMLTVTANSSALLPICGGNNSQRGLIQSRFGAHGISEFPLDQDPYEPNDGIETATNISTAPVISGRIFPKADMDYFGFGAGAGPMEFTLKLPANPGAPGNYFAYTLRLVDKNRQLVASATPAIDVNPTLSGFCPETNCMTTAPEVRLSYDNPSPGQFFLLVSAPSGDETFISQNNSTLFYTLTPSFNQAGAVAADIVTASFDNDLLNFSVAVSSFSAGQNYFFSHARLRDHNLTVLPQTSSDEAGSYLTFVSSSNLLGTTSGRLRLQPGFDGRFPAVGSVHLEVFAVNKLQQSAVDWPPVSLGISNAIALTTTRSQVKAWNNVFNPLRGERTTIRYELRSPGQLTMKLYTSQGVFIRTLFEGSVPAGKGAVDWEGRNMAGSTVASGIYLLRVEGPGLDETKKIIVVK